MNVHSQKQPGVFEGLIMVPESWSQGCSKTWSWMGLWVLPSEEPHTRLEVLTVIQGC